MSADNPGLGEQIGVAMNASSLSMEEGKERAVDRIAAFGYARLELTSDRTEHGRTPKPEPEQLAGELAVALWRAKYGNDHQAERTARVLFAAWIEQRVLAHAADATPDQVRRFADRVLWEWMVGRCVSCGGGGYQELVGRARRRPRTYARNIPLAICQACRGSGLQPANHGERRKILSAQADRMPKLDYERGWKQLFSQAMRWLRDAADRPHAPLLRSLGRRRGS